MPRTCKELDSLAAAFKGHRYSKRDGNETLTWESHLAGDSQRARKSRGVEALSQPFSICPYQPAGICVELDSGPAQQGQHLSSHQRSAKQGNWNTEIPQMMAARSTGHAQLELSPVRGGQEAHKGFQERSASGHTDSQPSALFQRCSPCLSWNNNFEETKFTFTIHGLLLPKILPETLCLPSPEKLNPHEALPSRMFGQLWVDSFPTMLTT